MIANALAILALSMALVDLFLAIRAAGKMDYSAAFKFLLNGALLASMVFEGLWRRGGL